MPRGQYARKSKPALTTQLATEETGSDLLVSSQGGTKLKVHIWPSFRGEDQGDGGIRRVVEGQVRYLSEYSIEVVDTPEEADVLACHMEMPPPWYNLYPDKTIVAHCHGLYWDDFKWDNWAIDANQKVMNLLRAADVITAPSEWVANSIRRATSRPVVVVHHGVDSEDWETDGSHLGYVLWNKTRPDPVCDPEPVNQVAKLLPSIQFITTFGDDAPNVSVTGKAPLEKARKVVQKAGVYLATSKETFGIGTLEAMAAGVPVVGYKWGGQPDIVREGKDGFLVQPGDVHSLALAIEGALHDRDLMSPLAKERAREFTWQKADETYAGLYRSAYENHSRPRPKVSVVVTNYNLHQYLTDCLDSIAKQDMDDWECIIVDDASPSIEGQKIANLYTEADSRFKLVVNEHNVYLAEARNVGVRLADGRYILPLDADDMLAPDALRNLSAGLDSDRTAYVAYGRVLFVDEDGKTPTVYEGFESTPGFSSWPYPFEFEKQIRQYNLLPYCSMFRREAWQHTGGYRPRCRTAEDAEFWTRLSSYGFKPKMVTQATTLVYRNRYNSMSREQKATDWVKWFPWSKDPSLTPAGASTVAQLPVPSLDKIAISVIIPVGPEHRLLVKDAVDSVDAQSFRNWECIVINDSGSTLDELPAWVHIVHGDPPHPVGVAAARNNGIRAAHAPLFLPLDADDYLQPNALQWFLDAYLQSRDIIYSDFWEDPEREKQFSAYQLKDYDASNLTRGTIHCVTALTPKSAWEKVGGYDETIPAWEDWDFQLKCADAGICSRRLASPLWNYRKHTGSRREANVKDFEASKAGILSKWSPLWDGRKQLVACSSCAARATIRPSQPPAMTTAQRMSAMPSGDAVVVRYLGDKKGNITYKGKSGSFYRFSSVDPIRYVLGSDVVVFQGHDDFEITTREALAAVPEAQGQPVLVAEGNPNA